MIRCVSRCVVVVVTVLVTVREYRCYVLLHAHSPSMCIVYKYVYMCGRAQGITNFTDKLDNLNYKFNILYIHLIHLITFTVQRIPSLDF